MFLITLQIYQTIFWLLKNERFRKSDSYHFAGIICKKWDLTDFVAQQYFCKNIGYETPFHLVSRISFIKFEVTLQENSQIRIASKFELSIIKYQYD